MTGTVKYILGFEFQTDTVDGIGPTTKWSDIALTLTDRTGYDIIETDIQSVHFHP